MQSYKIQMQRFGGIGLFAAETPNASVLAPNAWDSLHSIWDFQDSGRSV
jgi:hypothetical protein